MYYIIYFESLNSLKLLRLFYMSYYYDWYNY